MHPILINWGPLYIPTWHFLYVTGAVLAYFLMQRLRYISQSSIEYNQLNTLFILGYIASFFGARVLTIFVLAEPICVCGKARVRDAWSGALGCHGPACPGPRSEGGDFPTVEGA